MRTCGERGIIKATFTPKEDIMGKWVNHYCINHYLLVRTQINKKIISITIDGPKELVNILTVHEE